MRLKFQCANRYILFSLLFFVVTFNAEGFAQNKKQILPNTLKPSLTTFSYQTFTSNNEKQTQSLFSSQPSLTTTLKLDGQLGFYKTPLTLNGYVYSDNHGISKLRNYLFTLGNSKRYISFGDTNRFFFTPFTLSAQTLKGVKAFYSSPKGYEFLFSIAQLQVAKEGTKTSNGQYERLLYGARVVQNFQKAYLGLSYVTAQDKESSISVKGPNLTALNNHVVGIDVKFKPNEKLSVLAEAAASYVNADVAVNREQGTGKAFSFNVNYLWDENTFFDFLLKWSDGKFYSAGDTNLSGDANKRKIQGTANKNIPKFFNSQFRFALSNTLNNVQTSAVKPQTMENSGSFLWGMKPLNNLSASLSYALTKVGATMIQKDESNEVFGASSTYTFLKGMKISPSFSVATYKNAVFPVNDTDTNNVGLSLLLPLTRKLSLSYGHQKNKVLLVTAGKETQTQTHTAALGYLLFKDKMAGALSYVTSQVNSTFTTMDTRTNSVVLSAAYKLNSLGSALNLYVQLNDFNDRISRDKSYKTNSVNVAYILNFEKQPLFKGTGIERFFTPQKESISEATHPLEILVTEPEEGKILKGDFIVLRAKVSSSQKIKRITVNNKDVYFTMMDGVADFSYPLFLTTSSTKFNITAENETGDVAQKTMTLVYDASAPEISILSPQEETSKEQRMMLTGNAVDDTEISTLFINDEPYPVYGEKEVHFNKEIKLQEGENKLNIAAEDAAGRKKEKSIIINYTPEVKKESESVTPPWKEMKGEVIGVGPKAIVIYTEERLKEGDVLNIKRGEKTIAVVKVRSLKGKTVVTDIIEKHGEADSGDSIVKGQ